MTTESDQRIDLLRARVRDIPDFPKPGILFRDLTPMMGVMGDEVGQDMPDIERQVAPRVGLRGRDPTASGAPQLQEGRDATATAYEGRDELPAGDGPLVHPGRGDDPVLMPQGLYPPTPRIVEVAGDHSNGASWSPRHFGFP